MIEAQGLLGSPDVAAALKWLHSATRQPETQREAENWIGKVCEGFPQAACPR